MSCIVGPNLVGSSGSYIGSVGSSGNNTLVFSLDAANIADYPGYTGSNSWYDPISKLTIPLYNFNKWCSYDSVTKSINFTRDSTGYSGSNIDGFAAGGYGRLDTTGTIGSSYLYANHTTELIARVNDFTPANGYGYTGSVAYGTTENTSALLVFTGYHAMFMVGFQQPSSYFINYVIWDSPVSTISTSRIALGTAGSGAPIIQGNWFYIAVSADRLNKCFKTYLNGSLISTDNVSTLGYTGSIPTVTGGYLAIGAAATGSVYNFWSKSNIAITRLHRAVLTDSQILQNYNAFRGRFGI